MNPLTVHLCAADLEARMPRFLDVLADFAQSGRPELVLAAATW